MEKAREYNFSSLEFEDEEELAGAIECLSDEKRRFLYQRSSEKKQLYWEGKSMLNFQLHWEAQTEDDFLTGVLESVELIKQIEPNAGRIYIEFIPEVFLAGMNRLEFQIVSEWVDFWKTDLTSIEQSTGTQSKVRPLNREEACVAAAVTRSCAGYSRGFTGETDDMIIEWLDADDTQLLGAELDGNLIGISMLKLYGFESEKGTVLWIRELAVNPEYHRMGIGKELLQSALQWGTDHGAKRSFLAVDVENQSAISLYKKLGYARKMERGQINMELVLQREGSLKQD